MTTNFLKKIVFVLFIALIFTACDKMNWESIELNGQECPNAGLVMMQFSDATGVVKESDILKQKYIEVDKTNDLPGDMKLYPCNIANGELIVGKKIKISGVIYSIGDASDTTSLDTDLGQIVLSSAEYRK